MTDDEGARYTAVRQRKERWYHPEKLGGGYPEMLARRRLLDAGFITIGVAVVGSFEKEGSQVAAPSPTVTSVPTPETSVTAIP